MAKRTGNRPGQGRQPTIAPAGQVARITARVSEQQRVEYVRRGASQALRDWLDDKKELAMQLSEAIEEGLATLAHNARPEGWREADFGEVVAYVSPDAPEILGEQFPE